MTAQEQQMISGLADRIRTAPAPEIDRDAYDLILHTIGTRPDALYILTQTVLIQEMALNQAKAQIDQLKSQPAPQPQTSFLPGSQAGSQGGGWGQDSRLQQPSGYQGSGYASQAPPPPSGGGFSSFLHNAATTAAGVIAGELAFDSLSSLFGHRGGFFGGGGGGFFGGGGITPGSDTIINNYYDDDRGGRIDQGSGDDSRFAQAADQDQNISPDIDDERDNSGDSFADDSSYDDGGGSSDV
ncbi:MAG TPA: DUF2076 domain-containing protein [Bryobacteraceae bacterium]|jgi:hypothetical protein|nr:DUF2076 domain-containing protein [Bryobacteraceae bacterium]